jgi:uncharacterized DUF497 family protein
MKSASNKDKHGIDFEEAQALWEDAEAVRFTGPQKGRGVIL